MSVNNLSRNTNNGIIDRLFKSKKSNTTKNEIQIVNKPESNLKSSYEGSSINKGIGNPAINLFGEDELGVFDKLVESNKFDTNSIKSLDLIEKSILADELTVILEDVGIGFQFSVDILENIDKPKKSGNTENLQHDLNEEFDLNLKKDGKLGISTIKKVKLLKDASKEIEKRNSSVNVEAVVKNQKTFDGCHDSCLAAYFNSLHEGANFKENDDDYSNSNLSKLMRTYEKVDIKNWHAGEDGKGQLKLNSKAAKSKMKEIVSAIDNQLEKGKPAITPVSYKVSNANPGAPIIDHYVLIDGRGKDEKGVYYTFQDTTSSQKNGKLYFNPVTGALKGKGRNNSVNYNVYGVKYFEKTNKTPDSIPIFKKGDYDLVKIKDIQVKLSDINFYNSTFDGQYESGTVEAVSKFQKANKLPETGEIDTKTLNLINQRHEESKIPLVGPVQVNYPELEVKVEESTKEINGPTRKDFESIAVKSTNSPIVFKKGSKDNVKLNVLQAKLSVLDKYSASIDGDFGKGTENSIKDFQNSNGLTPTGNFNQETIDLLEIKFSEKIECSHEFDQGKQTIFKRGYNISGKESGSEFKGLQEKLNTLGYNTNGIDGIFGKGTESAVEKFQLDNNIEPSGKIDIQTWIEIIKK